MYSFQTAGSASIPTAYAATPSVFTLSYNAISFGISTLQWLHVGSQKQRMVYFALRECSATNLPVESCITRLCATLPRMLGLILLMRSQSFAFRVESAQ